MIYNGEKVKDFEIELFIRKTNKMKRKKTNAWVLYLWRAQFENIKSFTFNAI